MHDHAVLAGSAGNSKGFGSYCMGESQTCMFPMQRTACNGYNTYIKQLSSNWYHPVLCSCKLTLLDEFVAVLCKGHTLNQSAGIVEVNIRV